MIIRYLFYVWLCFLGLTGTTWSTVTLAADAPAETRPVLIPAPIDSAPEHATMPFTPTADMLADAPPGTLGNVIALKRLSFISIRNLPPPMRRIMRERLDANGSARASVADDAPGWPLDVAALQPNATTIGHLEIKPRNLAHSGFAAMRFLGWPFDDAHPGEAVVSLERYFARDDGATVVLREWNYGYGNAAIFVLRERINAEVDRHPAILSIETAPSGRVRSTLSWQDETTDYLITVLDDVDAPANGPIRYDRKWLIGLARSLGT
ncbi:hypothetical protein GALL_371020 [mine drainage metagenome]|uniref:Uncharacterized protein n=1 Tax=mine drainage metagenome TaxID=410659 RepID=A0A1J5QMI0_9ZZZZ